MTCLIDATARGALFIDGHPPPVSSEHCFYLDGEEPQLVWAKVHYHTANGFYVEFINPSPEFLSALSARALELSKIRQI